MKGTISIPAPGQQYCNAVGPECGKPPVAKVVTSHDSHLFTDLMCREHVQSYIDGMLNGRSVNVVGIFPIDPIGGRS